MSTKQMFFIGIGLSFFFAFFISMGDTQPSDNDIAVEFVHQQILEVLPFITRETTNFMKGDSKRLIKRKRNYKISSHFETQDGFGNKAKVNYAAIIEKKNGKWKLITLKFHNKLVRIGPMNF